MIAYRSRVLLLAFLVAALAAWGSWVIQRQIDREARENIAKSLVTVRDSTYHSVRTWFKEHEAAATVWANAPQVRKAAEELLAAPPHRSSLLASPAQHALREWFRRLENATRYRGFFIVGTDGTNLASSRDQNVGVENLLTPQEGSLERIWAGQTMVSLPVVSDVPLPHPDGALRSGLPTMFAGAPVFDDSGAVIAALLFRLDPAEGFSSILRQGRIGRSGETYAFDRHGRLISQSRYNEQLRAMGLVGKDEHGALNLHLRDPGVNLVEGERTDVALDRRPLTRMARSATGGQSSLDIGGYRDYRGVPVVGAWLWDEGLNLGLTTELDVDEAYAALRSTTHAIVALTLLVVVLLFGLATIFILYRQRRDTEAALRERESLFRVLLEGVGTDYLIYRLTLEDEEFRYLTPAIERFTGVPLERAIGRRWWELFNVTKETRSRLSAHDSDLRAGKVDVSQFEVTYVHPDGTERIVEVIERPEKDESGRIIAALGIVKDVTERNRAEEELRLAATVFDNTDEGIIVTDAERNVVVVNKAFSTITGYQASEVLGQTPSFQRSGRHDSDFYDELWRAVETEGQWRGEIWNQRKDGEAYPAWENIAAIKNEHGKVSSYVAVFSDISTVKASEERMAHLAHHDPLTGLPNRLRFTANLEQALATARRHQHKVALMFLDLDRFKLINDSLGHEAGDKLLRLVANRLKSCVRAEDTVARLGGDEFMIVLFEVAKAENVVPIAEHVVDAIRQPAELGVEAVTPSTSIGISVFPDDAATSDELVKAADAAMYHAKRRGRGNFQFYTSELSSKAAEQLTLEKGLRRALSEREFILHYQPQVSAESGRIVGLEALIRWQHPERGLLLPGEFIGIAEETDVIDAISAWVLRTAFSDVERWRSADRPAVRMAINLSARQFVRESSIRRILEVLEDLSPWAGDLELDLEVTESAMEGADGIIGVMNQLKRRGVMLAIDDFGKGHSSLSRLKELPVDALKIDQSFVKDITEDHDDKAIASAIIAMAHNLGLRVIGEGVENEAQLVILRELGCDELQGFYYSEAVSAKRIGDLLDRQHGDEYLHNWGRTPSSARARVSDK